MPRASHGGRRTKELEESEEETATVTNEITKVITCVTTAEEKEEKNEKVITEITTENTKNEQISKQTKRKEVRLRRRRERQRCSRLFPRVFSSFKLKKDLAAENMCPCPGSGKGVSQIILNKIDGPEDYDAFVLSLFEKKMAVEATFSAQVQRYYLNAADKLVSEETQPVSLKLIVTDDKVNEALSILEAQNLDVKAADAIVSPLLKGKTDYLKWQQNSLSQTKVPEAGASGDDESSDESKDESSD